MQTSESWFLYVCMRETVGVHIHHIAEGPGRCVSVRTLTRTPGVFTLATSLRCPSRYTYGQVEPLVLLNQITSEVAEDRYFRVSFPGNRPRDSAASAYFICVREPTPLPPSLFIRLSVRLPRVQPFSLASCFSVVTPCAQTRPPYLTLSLSCRLFDLYDSYQYLAQ